MKFEDYFYQNYLSSQLSSSNSHEHLTILIKEDIIWTESLYAEDITWLSKADKELISYLNSSTLSYLKSFTILDWWCVNESQYSTLACIAQDILSILITSVEVEQVFSHAQHVLNFCQNWLSATLIQKIMMSKYQLQYKERLHQEEKWQKNQQSNR